jgi:hypothetical protein
MVWLFSLVIPSLDLASFGFNSFEPWKMNSENAVLQATSS